MSTTAFINFYVKTSKRKWIKISEASSNIVRDIIRWKESDYIEKPKDFDIEFEHKKGNFYNANNFKNLLIDIKKAIKKRKKELNRLIKIKQSIDYYKLNEIEKDSLISDINNVEETIRDYKIDKHHIKKIIDVFNYFNNDVNIEDGYIEDVIIYIYIE